MVSDASTRVHIATPKFASTSTKILYHPTLPLLDGEDRPGLGGLVAIYYRRGNI